MPRFRIFLIDPIVAILAAALTVSSCAAPGTLPAGELGSTRTASATKPVVVTMVFPHDGMKFVMGQSLVVLARVDDGNGVAVRDARSTLEIKDPTGKVMATLITDQIGAGDVYRFEPWVMPHRVLDGSWQISVRAVTDQTQGEAHSTLQVQDSTSEVLLGKYGFWLDAPSLRSIIPQLYSERGDAQNGMIQWGGYIPAQHVQPANWVEIQWRKGDFNLVDSTSARRFILTEIGNPGFTPLREIGSFEPVRFKNWEAWKAHCQGQFTQDQVEWLIFFAPEVDKTFAIGTTVVLPPPGIDAHAQLVNSFEVVPGVRASGLAPEPLPRLLPAPQPISPDLGARFSGTSQPIALRWAPAKVLATDEYYQVAVDYNYGESNPLVKLATRQTSLTLPERLYSTPNCHVFNWQVTLMRKTGATSDGQPTGEPMSYTSLYWYVWWDYPEGQSPPFNAGCPNAQF